MKPVAVLISDIHYSLQTLELADAALRQAIKKANDLKVPLIVAGDLHDTKANMRAECVNAIIKTFKLCDSPPYIMTGNHDKINEKSSEHALNFLREYGAVIDTPVKLHKVGYLIPYYNDVDELRAYLKTLPKGSSLVMHQGIQGSNSGEYYQDKSALKPEDVAGFRVISGHYHARQNLELPDGGLWSYIGNPYTLNFGEVNDREKGYQILYDNNTLEFVPTNLRKHVVVELDADSGRLLNNKHRKMDLVKVNVFGSRENVSKWTREKLVSLIGREDFKVDQVVTGSFNRVLNSLVPKEELLDSVIDSINGSDTIKTRLKQLWRDLCD